MLPVVIILGALVLIVLLILSGTFFTVRQQTAALVERWGKFSRVAPAGLNVKTPFVERVAGRISLRVIQLDVPVETKTKDNVFVIVRVSIQFFVITEKVYDAFYRLNNRDEQIKAFVFDLVRARVPLLTLDELFEKKDEIADAVKNELTTQMDDFGYGILKALMTDIDPDEKVKVAMNEINANERLRVAATAKGEADKILVVKAAEAEAQSKRLQGEGIANQRKAIIEGLRQSVEEFREGIPGVTPQDVMMLVLLTQYFDTLKDIGTTPGKTAVFVPHSPGGLGNLVDQLRDAIMMGSEGSAAAMHSAPGKGGA